MFVTLAWIATPPTLLIAFILETANRLTNVVFKFVPMRLGVDEAGSALLTTVLGYTSATGATLALVRKVRMLFWTAVGRVLPGPLARRRRLTAQTIVTRSGTSAPGACSGRCSGEA